MDSVLVSEKELRELIYDKFTRVGYPIEQAKEMANHLSYADSIGLSSHGSLRTKYTVFKIENKGVNLNPELKFIEKSYASAFLDAQNGSGMYVVNKACEFGIKQAQEKGIYMINITNITHSGTMSYYVRKIAEHNLIGITMCNTEPQVLPTNGKKPYFGTNPLAYGIPTNDDPIVFDMSTSVHALGKILLADLDNKSIPDHWAVDEEGQPTTNPSEVAYLLPVGGSKGYGLGMLVDVLCAMLIDAPFGENIPKYEDTIDGEGKISQFMFFINPAIYSDINTFLNNMSLMVEQLHKVEPYDESKPVVVPGESSKARYLKYKEQGIPISKKIYEYLNN